MALAHPLSIPHRLRYSKSDVELDDGPLVDAPDEFEEDGPIEDEVEVELVDDAEVDAAVVANDVELK